MSIIYLAFSNLKKKHTEIQNTPSKQTNYMGWDLILICCSKSVYGSTFLKLNTIEPQNDYSSKFELPL